LERASIGGDEFLPSVTKPPFQFFATALPVHLRELCPTAVADVSSAFGKPFDSAFQRCGG
jgi:hypothetical protein